MHHAEMIMSVQSEFLLTIYGAYTNFYAMVKSEIGLDLTISIHAHPSLRIKACSNVYACYSTNITLNIFDIY